MNPLETAFATLPDLIRRHARAAPQHVALVEGERQLDYAALDALMDRVACALQRSSIGPGHCVAICAAASIEYVAVFLGTLRAGAAVAPLPASTTTAALRAMLDDAEPRLLFLDQAAAETLDAPSVEVASTGAAPCTSRISLDEPRAGGAFQTWLADAGPAPGRIPEPVAIDPQAPFNIIYSSGTTGAPKGIVQSHAMRWAHVQRGAHYGYCR